MIKANLIICLDQTLYIVESLGQTTKHCSGNIVFPINGSYCLPQETLLQEQNLLLSENFSKNIQKHFGSGN